jgi:AcrR family transcriptional regulator
MPDMPRKRRRPYHHGDLSRALVEEAIGTIQRGGVQALTLRAVGEKLGVSRTALYRHFPDKSALLAAVGREGFRTLRERLHEAWRRSGGGQPGLEAMGGAYVQFAVDHPSHYRVMFGGHLGGQAARDSELEREGAAAFDTLVEAVVSLQQQGTIRLDPPLRLAQYIWASVHGIAMLAIDGQLREPAQVIVNLANERIRTGIAL